METKTNFERVIDRLKEVTVGFGFTFEKGGIPNNPTDPPYIGIISNLGMCCVYDPMYNPPSQKDSCISLLIFNDQQKNLALSGILAVPIYHFFDNITVIEALKYLLIAKINPKKEKLHIKRLLSRIRDIERWTNNDHCFSISVALKDKKAVLDRHELENYLQ